MAWIESHQSLGRHPKLMRLAVVLGVEDAAAVGYLHYLWWWAIDYAPAGDLTKMTDAEVALAAGWKGDAKAFRGALSECGFIDADGHLHDWDDYSGGLILSRKRDAKRKRDGRRSSAGRPPDVHRPSTVHNTTQQTQPNPTDQTNPSPPKAIITGWFEALWGRYPSKDGKKAAERHFLATVHDVEDLRRITQALDRYLASDRVRNGYVKNGSTWFNNWPDWVDFTETAKGGPNGKTPENGFRVGAAGRPEPDPGAVQL